MAKPTRQKFSLFLICAAALAVVGLAAYYLFGSGGKPVGTEEHAPPAPLDSQEASRPASTATTSPDPKPPTPASLPTPAFGIPKPKNLDASGEPDLSALASVEESTPGTPGSEKEPGENGPFADSPAIHAQETVKMDPPMREIGQAWLDGQGQSDLSMPVSGGRDLEIEFERLEAIGDDGGEFIGTVKGRPGSSVHLSYRGEAEAGTIRIPSENRVYRIFPGQGGAIVIQDRNLAMEEQSGSAPPLDMELPPVPDFTPPPPPSDLVESLPESQE